MWYASALSIGLHATPLLPMCMEYPYSSLDSNFLILKIDYNQTPPWNSWTNNPFLEEGLWSMQLTPMKQTIPTN